MAIPYFILAEKPSQAKAIAQMLGIKSRGNKYYELKDGGVVGHARGHLLTVDKRTHADWDKGSWTLDNLPVAPTEWIMCPAKDVAQELAVVKRFLADTKRVIIATDAGREGELIARELLTYFKFRGTVERFWTSTMTTKDLKAAWASLLPASRTEGYYASALARQRCDLMYGYTMTRAVTLGMNTRKVKPCGRVKTPLMYMVVKREWDIRNFKVKTYYELDAKVRVQSGATVMLRHAPAEADRVYEKTEIQRRQALAENYIGPIQVKKENMKLSPKPFYSLDTFAYDADKKLGLSGKSAEEVLQRLYDEELVSYPRTDSEYLGESQKDEMPEILTNICAINPHLADMVKETNNQLTLRKEFFDDKKLTDHHGIIPTGVVKPLSGLDLQVYLMICERFLRALSADYLYEHTKLTLNAKGVEFSTTGNIPTRMGWKSIKLNYSGK